MKNIFIQYCSYNLWATSSLITTIKNLPEKVQHAEVKSSFPSLYKTILHLLDAEIIWWNRLNSDEITDVTNRRFHGELSDIALQLHQYQSRWFDRILAIEEKDFYNEVSYNNLKGEAFTQPVYQILLHIFNHGSYHRGQLITMLQQLEVQEFPQTDFILWSRNKDSNKKLFV
jgi:uncharacterized damage-inducible protein DinB